MIQTPVFPRARITVRGRTKVVKDISGSNFNGEGWNLTGTEIGTGAPFSWKQYSDGGEIEWLEGPY